MNRSILIDSFRFVNDKFKSISNLSMWTHDHLSSKQYDRQKLIRALRKNDDEAIIVLIGFDSEFEVDSKLLNEHSSIMLLNLMLLSESASVTGILNYIVDKSILIPYWLLFRSIKLNKLELMIDIANRNVKCKDIYNSYNATYLVLHCLMYGNVKWIENVFIPELNQRRINLVLNNRIISYGDMKSKYYQKFII